MWLYIIALVLAVLAVIGGIASGGIFLIILLPLAAVALIVAVLVSVLLRPRRSDKTTASHAESPGPFPSGQGPAPVQTPATPDQFVDARRRAQ